MSLLGILAGMGPKSTAPFVSSVVRQCQLQYGAVEDLDFPHMLIYSLPTPVSLHSPLAEEPFCRAVEGGLQRLADNGVSVIAMPCNTAHLFYPRLAASVGVPLIDMIETAAAGVPESTRTIALLATRFTVDGRLYQDSLARRGHEVIAGEPWQERVDRLLDEIRVSADLSEAGRRWKGLTADLEAAGADSLLIACTDLNPVLEIAPAGLPLVDATELLAAELVARWRASSSPPQD